MYFQNVGERTIINNVLKFMSVLNRKIMENPTIIEEYEEEDNFKELQC